MTAIIFKALQSVHILVEISSHIIFKIRSFWQEALNIRLNSVQHYHLYWVQILAVLINLQTVPAFKAREESESCLGWDPLTEFQTATRH